MNAITFATSRAAGFMVVWVVACVVISAIVVVALVHERRENLRRAARVRDARAQRDARVRTFPAGAALRVLRPREGPRLDDRSAAAARARRSGVDEMQIENVSLWAERSR